MISWALLKQPALWRVGLTFCDLKMMLIENSHFSSLSLIVDFKHWLLNSCFHLYHSQYECCEHYSCPEHHSQCLGQRCLGKNQLVDQGWRTTLEQISSWWPTGPGPRKRCSTELRWALPSQGKPGCARNIQTYLGDFAGLFLDHCNKADITVEQVKCIFWFPSAYESYVCTEL